MAKQFTPGSQAALNFLNSLLAAKGVDTKAADAVFSREGASGRIGDGGHAFGPGQFNNAGGAWTGRYSGLSPQQINEIAWSAPGLRELAQRVASVSAGLHGEQAIQNIVTRFERPAAPGAEIAGALAAYGTPLRGSAQATRPASAGASGPLDVLKTLGADGGAGANMRQLLSQYMLSQAQDTLHGTPDNGSGILGLAMARKALMAAGPPTAAPSTSQASPTRDTGTTTLGGEAGGFLPKGVSYIPGRLDQGHDFQTDPGAPIVAPGNGVVLSVRSDPHGFGPSYPIVHFTSGPYAGKTIYIGHTLSQLKPGQAFAAGTVISKTGTTPIGNAAVPGWAEIGFATGGLPGPDGQSTPF